MMNQASNQTFWLILILTLLAAWLLPKIKRRLELSKAKHPSLTGHSKWSRRLARLIPFYEYDAEAFFKSDHAPEAVVNLRKAGFEKLTRYFQEKFSKTVAAASQVEDGLSDMQFTSKYRVPFQYSAYIKQHLKMGSFLQSSAGVTVTDLDNNTFYDLTGSYGVNVFGYDFYKQCIAEGAKLAEKLGPVLGAYHPLIIENVQKLKAISGLDEVSFHMSGTEAVMQAVRLARYHTNRTHVVRFCGAYNGWWGDVQPGIGNPTPADYTYTLKEMDNDTLHVLNTRKDIACVIVNPLQALHPNKGAPGDSSLVDSSRSAHFDRQAYGRWLQQLREVCILKNIVLIFDEVFVGFRIASGGAQSYFGVKADMVTYGKTIAGGLPVGVVCGQAHLMKRFKENAPANICFARGTFNAHPYVMATMNVFLKRLEEVDIQAIYQNLDHTWDSRAALLNARLAQENLPVKVVNFSSIWTICYTLPSRYNWMLQYYLRANGLALSWVGSGRLIFSLNYRDEDFQAVVERFITAAKAMQQDGWWWQHETLTNTAIKRQISKEMIAQYLKFNRSKPIEI